MNVKQALFFGASMLASSLCVSASGQELQGQYVQLAEIEIDPGQLEDYKAAVREQIETAVRIEPGVLVLYAVSEKDNPTHVRVFEIYRDADAYRSLCSARKRSEKRRKFRLVVVTRRMRETRPSTKCGPGHL